MKVTIKGIIHYRKRPLDEPKYVFYECNMSDCGPHYVPMFEHQFDVEIPDNFDPTPKMIAALKAAKQKILADANVKANNIDEQIQKLLCIEHRPEVTA